MNSAPIKNITKRMNRFGSAVFGLIFASFSSQAWSWIDHTAACPAGEIKQFKSGIQGGACQPDMPYKTIYPSLDAGAAALSACRDRLIAENPNIFFGPIYQTSTQGDVGVGLSFDGHGDNNLAGLERQCVNPPPEDSCPIDPIQPITDPEVQSFEGGRIDKARLTPRMQTALQCLENAVSQAGGTASLRSAYRLPAYNQHLIDVWNKWVTELRTNNSPACRRLKGEVNAHFVDHELVVSQPPVENSRHTRGEAFDVGVIGLTWNQVDAAVIRSGCNIRRPVPVKDPTHFQHR